MTCTEKVTLSATALSFLLYECLKCEYSQEGFLLGYVTSLKTNHVSDSHNDNARHNTQITITCAYPLPLLQLFYTSTGKIKEDILEKLLKNASPRIVGWYKYRRDTSIEPTFRDKTVTRELQKYFDNKHGTKTFVSCNITRTESHGGSTHTLVYKFGKMTPFDGYQRIEEISENLGLKTTGYKIGVPLPLNCPFKKFLDSNITKNDTVMTIEKAINAKLVSEAKKAAKSECRIRELTTEIREMCSILNDKHAVDLKLAYSKKAEKDINRLEREMAEDFIHRVMKKRPNLSPRNDTVITQNKKNRQSKIKRPTLQQKKITTRSSTKCTQKQSSSTKCTQKQSSSITSLSFIKANAKHPSISTNSCKDLITFDDEDKPQVKRELRIIIPRCDQIRTQSNKKTKLRKTSSKN